MRYLQPNCPECGLKAIGTIESVPGLARFDLDETGTFLDWTGETDMFWDGSTTVEDDQGRSLLSCGAHEWYSLVELDLADGTTQLQPAKTA